MPQVHDALDRCKKFFVYADRVIAQDVHVETRALLCHGLSDSASANNRDGLAGYFVAEKRKIRMPKSPFVFANEFLRHPQPSRQRCKSEKSELSSRFGQHVGRVRVRNLVPIGSRAVDVVIPYCELRYGF